MNHTNLKSTLNSSLKYIYRHFFTVLRGQLAQAQWEKNLQRRITDHVTGQVGFVTFYW